jgi:hypothetical protein
LNIAYQRMHNQHITRHPLATPAEVVAWLGAVQSQDYGGATWAVGQRAQDATAASVEQAFTEGAILRTHVMRPTWHFVAPADIRWLLALTGPRVHTANAHYYRQSGLDEALLRRSNDVLAAALQGGKYLTRDELAATLQQASISTEGTIRLSYIMMYAELEGIICSGPRRGKQFTYALLEERVPPVPPLDREAALAALARRYLASRGPASVADCVWWSGLTTADVKTAFALVAAEFEQAEIAGQTYWFPPSAPPVIDPSLTAYLLPNYDEYVSGYKDRSALIAEENTNKFDPQANIVFSHFIVIDSQIIGTWQRTLKKNSVIIDRSPFTPLSDAEAAAFAAAAERYGRFLGLPVTLGEEGQPGHRGSQPMVGKLFQTASPQGVKSTETPLTE